MDEIAVFIQKQRAGHAFLLEGIVGEVKFVIALDHGFLKLAFNVEPGHNIAVASLQFIKDGGYGQTGVIGIDGGPDFFGGQVVRAGGEEDGRCRRQRLDGGNRRGGERGGSRRRGGRCGRRYGRGRGGFLRRLVDVAQLSRCVAGGSNVGIIADQQHGRDHKYAGACRDQRIKKGLAQRLFLAAVGRARIVPVGIVAGAAGWLLVFQGASLLLYRKG